MNSGRITEVKNDAAVVAADDNLRANKSLPDEVEHNLLGRADAKWLGRAREDFFAFRM